MLDLSKSYDFFQPEKDDSMIHIVGCGSVGSTVAENLARCGVKNFTLWDFDDVEPHNIVNQMFRQQDVGRPKVEALRDILIEINPELSNSIKLKPKGWNGEMLSGYIFLAVDSIEIRKKIIETIFNNVYVKAVFDFRTLLESAQSYAADWSSRELRQNLLNSMQFSHDEAAEETPVSACGVTLGVATVVRIIAALGVDNYINFVKGKGIKKFIQIDAFNYILDAF
jgi:hypothetical protein